MFHYLIHATTLLSFILDLVSAKPATLWTFINVTSMAVAANAMFHRPGLWLPEAGYRGDEGSCIHNSFSWIQGYRTSHQTFAIVREWRRSSMW